MEFITVNCPQCETRLQMAPNRSRVICSRCGAAYESRDFGPAAMFKAESSVGLGPEEVIETRLAELGESIEGLQTEIEALRSRELSAPLQLGCSFFGLFVGVTVVLAGSMLLGRSYFGSWMFYACLVVVVLLGIARVRRKLKTRVPADQIRRDRVELEETLADLLRERDRVRDLRARLRSHNQPDRL